MSVADTLVKYLAEQDVPFDVLVHKRAEHSAESAREAHIPGGSLAKSVLLEDEQGYVIAVLPAVNRLDFGELHRQFNRLLNLAGEPALAAVFQDCEPGAVPAMAPAYGLSALVDDQLAEQADIYFEAGDHEHLVHVSGETFSGLMSDARFGRFSYHG